MGKHDDKYRDDAADQELSQVRNIIKHLNEEKPSTERRREVVTRKDGSKVVRVTKRRKVLLNDSDKRRKSRKAVMLFLLGCFVVVALMAVFYLFRMTSMSGDRFMEEQRVALQKAWGATSLQWSGAGVEGTTLHLTSLTAEFPESCMIRSVDMGNIEADLDSLTFVTGVLRADKLKIGRADVRLRAGVDKLSIPKAVEDTNKLWKVRRVECDAFSLTFDGEQSRAPFSLKNSKAYMYYPRKDSDISVTMLTEGSLEIKGWKRVNIREAKLSLSALALEDFFLKGTTDALSDVPEASRTSISFGGRLADGASLASPLSVDSDNMNLIDFTEGRFDHFFTARTVSATRGRISDKASIVLPFGDKEAPAFSGEFQLKGIALSSMPALMSVVEHLESSRRKGYYTPSIHHGYVCISRHGSDIAMELPVGAVEERDLIALRGKIVVTDTNELSGSLEYGIPAVLTHAEYPDGKADPIFREDGQYAWLSTTLSGLANRPADNMSEIEARAVEARRSRPARLPLNQIDFETLTKKLSADEALGGTPEEQGDSPQKSGSDSPRREPSDPFSTAPADDPFATPVPF